MPDFSTSSARPGGVPDISLGVQPVQAGGLFDSGSAIDAISKLATTQNALNANREFQQQFFAKQRAGQIISQSPDMETAIKNIQADPVTASRSGEIINSLRSADLTLQQVQNAKQQLKNAQQEYGIKGQEASQSALAGAIKALSASAANPSMMPSIIASQKKTFAPGSSAGDALDTLVAGTMNGLEKLPPEQRLPEFRKRMIANGVSAGVSFDELSKQFGTPVLPDVKFGVQPGTQNPTYLGGGITANGPVIPFGVPLGTETTAGGAVIPRGGLDGNGNPLMPGPLLSSPLSAASAGAGSSAAAGTPAGKPAPLNSFGEPLYTGSLTGLAPQQPGATLTVGQPNLTPQQRKLNDDAITQYSTTGAEQFKSAQAGLGLLNLQDKAFEDINKDGGWQVSGFAGDARNAFARAANTIAMMTGNTKSDGTPDLSNMPFPVEKVGDWESIVKDTNTLSGMLTKQFFPGGHNAAETIGRVVNSVPSISNSPLGARMVSDGLKSVMNRVMDERKFTNDYMAQNSGLINGSDIEFNKRFPPDYYSNKVLEKYGMDEKGFLSEAAIGKALADKLLTPEQALAARRALPKDRK